MTLIHGVRRRCLGGDIHLLGADPAGEEEPRPGLRTAHSVEEVAPPRREIEWKIRSDDRRLEFRVRSQALVGTFELQVIAQEVAQTPAEEHVVLRMQPLIVVQPAVAEESSELELTL